jgi:8-oxo-dGTP pyrophosphatase MutT (NUDIX family)
VQENSDRLLEAPTRVRTLAQSLQGSLPGKKGQSLMWPRDLSSDRFNRPPDDARLAAVLILLYEREGRICFPLQRRKEVIGDPHGGQISLPGGSREGRERVEATALREAQEELGIEPERVRILGRLSRLWIPVSHFKVRPVVAWTESEPAYRLDPKEVEQLILCSLEELENPRRMVSFNRRIRGKTRRVPAWHLDDGYLWGATAMILAELISIVRAAEGLPSLPLPPD